MNTRKIVRAQEGPIAAARTKQHKRRGNTTRYRHGDGGEGERKETEGEARQKARRENGGGKRKKSYSTR